MKAVLTNRMKWNSLHSRIFLSDHFETNLSYLVNKYHAPCSDMVLNSLFNRLICYLFGSNVQVTLIRVIHMSTGPINLTSVVYLLSDYL